jgi:arabinofuranosyltransferase
VAGPEKSSARTTGGRNGTGLPDRPGPGRTARAARWHVDPFDLAVIALPVLAFLMLGWQKRWTHDDGFITFRVVDQIFAGHGPVFNAGQRVEAFTSPLHVVLLVVLRALLGWALDEGWLSALLTLGAATGGLLAAAAGATRLARRGGSVGRLVPFTLLVPVALPAMWEFATAGLETGLAIGWVGLTFWLLARVATTRRPLRLWPVAMLAGLGPLVRPECAILSVGFVAALLLSRAAARGDGRAPGWRLLGAAVALPLAYEVFRAGYYANLLPNTALAKEAGESRWGQGWFYLLNTVSPYLLVVPLLAAAGWVAFGRTWSLRRSFGGRDGLVLVAVTVGCAALYLLYVVRVGGDYMHARMLLVPIFALCCPLAVVPLPPPGQTRAVVLALAVVVAGWGALVGVNRRAPLPRGFFSSHAVAEQRPFFVGFARNPHPVTLDEWRHSAFENDALDVRRAHDAGRDVLLNRVGYPGIDLPPETPLPAGRGTYLYIDGIGVVSDFAGPDVHIIDFHGLADPIASRLPVARPRGLPGHEKQLPQTWALAEAGARRDDPAVRAAADALRCGELAPLRRAIDGPLTVGRFFRNLAAAPGLTTLQVPLDPTEATGGCR